MAYRQLTSASTSITSQLVSTGKIDWRSVGVSALMMPVNDAVAKQGYTGVSEALAQGALGAVTAKLNKKDAWAGAIGGVAGSIVGQLMPRAFDAMGFDPYGAPGGASGPAPDPSKIHSWGDFTDSLTSDTNKMFTAADQLSMTIGAIGASVGKAFAQLTHRDQGVAAQAASGAASSSYNTHVSDVRQAAAAKAAAEQRDRDIEEANKAKAKPEPEPQPSAKPVPKSSVFGSPKNPFLTPLSGLNPDFQLGGFSFDAKGMLTYMDAPVPESSREPVTAHSLADEVSAKLAQLRKEGVGKQASVDLVNAWAQDEKGYQGELLQNIGIKRRDTLTGISAAQYGSDNTNAGYGMLLAMNGRTGMAGTQIRAGDSVIGYTPEAAEDILADKSAQRMFDKYGRGYIAQEEKIHVQERAVELQKANYAAPHRRLSER